VKIKNRKMTPEQEARDDVVMAMDRQYFLDHPRAQFYYRPVHEFEDVRDDFDADFLTTCRMYVEQHEPGVRTRMLTSPNPPPSTIHRVTSDLEKA
jgi:hypothetical protein